MSSKGFDPYSSAVELARQIRSREVSPIEVMHHYLDRVERLNPEINAFVWLDTEQAIHAAEASQARLDSGEHIRPFEGVPLPLKDFGEALGQPNTMGSNAVSDALAQHDGIIAQLFRSAGFVFMGRTNTPEFTALTETVNARYGATRNPWDTSRSAGGSSGGAAAAVAAGMAPLAHGSDGGGSIRNPASANGLVGLKPSRGRVPREIGYWDFAFTDGVITRTVEDSAAVLDILAARDPLGWFVSDSPKTSFVHELKNPTGPLRIGVLSLENCGVVVDEECVLAVEATSQYLESLGHRVTQVDAFLFDGAVLQAFVNQVISAYVASTENADPRQCDPYIQYRFDQAASFSSTEYVSLQIEIQRQARRVVQQWDETFDVLITPTMATRVPPVGEVYEEANRDPGGERLLERKMATFTLPYNLAGLPAATFPISMDSDGLPIGVQFIGGPGGESKLFQLGYALEQHFRWHERQPNLA